ncbi:MAG: YicC family protein [Rhodovulum sulfidophilum]|uniref:YicC family protein n=1 Tax=Rhodovulum sulfidophilum TaxID=35806 RepID=A0A2W5N771_RHOSU|nr:MAG: YicC family protein [Rhodovulum sulfidophilum]
MTLVSMTGFAGHPGAVGEVSWTWEARSVNGRNLDLRLRLPEGFERLEAPLRAALAAALSRGSVTVGLRVTHGAASAAPRLSPVGLEQAILAVELAGDAAARRGLPLAPMTAADLLAVRGVLEQDQSQPAENAQVMERLLADIPELTRKLRASRAEEGAQIAVAITDRVDRIADLAGQAKVAAEARGPRAAALLRARIDAVLGQLSQIDEGRLAQELALIAVKADVSEELDRIGAHIVAARNLLRAEGPVGRRLDFLTQEFNREANTLCAKSGASDLTAIGLEMKVAIDQLREQVQNVE